MSTRAHLGYGPLDRFKGLYLNSGGGPQTIIPLLVAWLLKNGFDQFVSTIDKTRGGGGSYFDDSLNPNSLVDLPYNHGEHISRRKALDQEYVYVVFPDKINVYNYEDKLGTVDLTSIPKRKVIKYMFVESVPKRYFKDDVYTFIGRVVFEESDL